VVEEVQGLLDDLHGLPHVAFPIYVYSIYEQGVEYYTMFLRKLATIFLDETLTGWFTICLGLSVLCQLCRDSWTFC